MKYYQQSLSTLAAAMTETEKQNIKFECKKFINNNRKLILKFPSSTQEEQEWILNYLSLGKGTIPYEIITRFNSLDIRPDQEFFCIKQFYSRLKSGIISQEQCKAVKNLYVTMKMENLGKLNMLYNFQDAIILCEIFESRATYLNKNFKFNPRKCNSANSFSGCVHRDKSKCIIAFQTDAETVKIFEKTLIGGFSSVDTHLPFDSQILLPKNQRDQMKLIYKIKTTAGGYENKKISTKILKMDENNQYGNAMTKDLPYGCIKKMKKIPSLREFNMILSNISHTDKIGHLFIVDIKFHVKN